MDSERFSLVRAIFEEVEGLPYAEARSVARIRSGGDEGLFAEVVALLDADQSGDDFLDSWVHAADVAREGPLADSALGRSIGGFTIRRVVGTGGMGTVYEAEQDEPRRTIALKTLRDGFSSDEARERFRWESRILARLEHPAIARVYAVGTFRREGGATTPYFAMEYIEGARDVRTWVEDERPARVDVLRLFRSICEAVQHGHDRGVLHRDLKPGNLLVDREGNPKVIDFGVARTLDPEVTAPRTSAGELVGTLAYMSPEQVGGPTDDVDVRTDVYALGVVLYELLCGCKPISLEGRALGDAVAAIRDEVPRRPSAIDASLKGDLEWICLRALEKDPERRYASPAALADDLTRHLEHRPVSAGPPGPVYRLMKFVRRNRVVVSLAAAVVVALVTGAAVSLRQFERAEVEAETRGRVSLFLADMLTRVRPEVALGPELTVRELLDWAAGELERRFEGDSVVKAELHGTIGESYMALGRFDEAKVHFLRSSEQMEALLGRYSYDHVVTLTALARLDTACGRYSEAVARYEEILPRIREQYSDRPETLTANLVNYAIPLFDVGRADEALAVAREALELRRASYGPTDERVLRVTLMLASQLSLAGYQGEAEQLFAEVARGMKHLQGMNGLLTNYANEYGGFLLTLERPQEAVEVFAQGLRDSIALYGEDHANSLVMQVNLANTLVHCDRVEEGLAQYDVVFRPDRELPSVKMRTTTHRLIYVEGLRRTGRIDDARVQLDLWAKEANEELPPDHPAFALAAGIRASLDPAEDD